MSYLDFELYEELRGLSKEQKEEILSYVRFKKSQGDIAVILNRTIRRLSTTEELTLDGIKVADKDVKTLITAIQIGMDFVRRCKR